jgi:hypothetical protein
VAATNPKATAEKSRCEDPQTSGDGESSIGSNND